MKERIEEYRTKLFSAIKKALEEDGHHKSYEGRVEVTKIYPDYFDESKSPTWRIRLSCYVLGPTRGYEYYGKTLDECLNKAEKDLEQWTKD